MKCWGLCRLEGELLPGPTHPRTLSIAEFGVGSHVALRRAELLWRASLQGAHWEHTGNVAHIHGSPPSPPQSSLSLAPACCC